MEDQLNVDPTGVLSNFWLEQRRMLKKHKQKRWNPEVLRYCLFMWIRLGNSKFDSLRSSKGGILTLPSRRTLQIEKLKLPVNGDGFNKDTFMALKKEIDLKPNCTSADYDVILSWDATGNPNP